MQNGWLRTPGTRVALWIVLALAVAVLGMIQLASESIAGRFGVEHSLPRMLPPALGVSIDSALARAIDLPFLHEMLAEAALSRDDQTEAQRQIDLLPRSKFRLSLLGRLYDMQGRNGEAFNAYLEADDIQALTRRVEAADVRHEGNVNEALRQQHLLVDRLRDNPTRSDALAHAYWSLGVLDAEVGYRDPSKSAQAWPQALADYEAALQLTPLSAQIVLAAANQALLLDRPAKALEYFKRTVEIDPRSTEAYSGIARAELKLGDLRDARRQIALLPPSRTRKAIEGLLYEREGRGLDAFKAFTEAGDIDAMRRTALATDRDHQGDVHEAIRRQRVVIHFLTADPARRYQLAEAYWQLGVLDAELGYREAAVRETSWRRALSDYELASAVDLRSPQYLLSAANQALMLGETRRAIGLYQRTLRLEPRSADALAGLGKAQLTLGNREAAAEALGAARTLAPNNPDVHALAAALAK